MSIRSSACRLLPLLVVAALATPATSQVLPFGSIAREVGLANERFRVLQQESGTGRMTVAPPTTPLPGSNGPPPLKEVRSTEIAPVSLSRTVARLSDAEQSALRSTLTAEIERLVEELNVRLAVDPRSPAINQEIEQLNHSISAKRQALELASGQPTTLTSAGAESFAALTNPYFLVCGNSLWAPRDPLKWSEVLEKSKNRLLDAGRSVAMVEIDGRPAGTAFVVGKSHVVTNLHVVKIIADYDSGKKKWSIKSNVKIKFDAEYALGPSAGCAQPNPSRTYYVNGVYATAPDMKDDVAVLLTSADSDFPKPLQVKAKSPDRYAGNMIVAVLGYPGPPTDMTVTEQLQFFRTPTASTPQFVYKRVSGGYTGTDIVDGDGYFTHKANTSGGNSGSPVFDIEDGEVVGIHVAGYDRFQNVMGYNRALTGERVLRLLKRAGLVTN